MAIPTTLAKAIHPIILLSDTTRAYVLVLLAKNKRGLCVQDIAAKAGVSHSAMCHQLAKLERLKVVSSARRGQQVVYTLTKQPLVAQLVRILKAVKML